MHIICELSIFQRVMHRAKLHFEYLFGLRVNRLCDLSKKCNIIILKIIESQSHAMAILFDPF